MAPAYGTLHDVHLHLSAAVLSLAGFMPAATPAELRNLLRIGRLLASAERRLQRATRVGR